jgi:menaquinone-specific isochorismate synthase
METRQTAGDPTTGAFNITNFLQSGAVLRASPGVWFLLQGPFTAKSEVAADEVALFHPSYFMSTNATYWVPAALHTLTDGQWTELLQNAPVASIIPESTQGLSAWSEASFESFEISFNEILSRIEKGPLKKAVPVVFEQSSAKPNAADLVHMLKSLIKVPRNLYVYGFWQNGEGILGATPEVLLRQDGEFLTTMALAGTCPKEDLGTRTPLMEDAKERHEHDLVAQDVVYSLREYGDVQTDGPKLLELPSLFHLKTDLQCHLKEPGSFQFFEACKKLHPTPALGVSPRSYGIDWMRELPEQSKRKGFGAPWGLKWSPQEALCLVAIRNLQWTHDGSQLGAGCGLVGQSVLQQEWRELFQKRLSVKKVLGLHT